MDDTPGTSIFEIDRPETNIAVAGYTPPYQIECIADLSYKETGRDKQDEKINVLFRSSGNIQYTAKIVNVEGNTEIFSLDDLASVAVDLRYDTSTMTNTIFSNHQRNLMDVIYNHKSRREKFVTVHTERIVLANREHVQDLSTASYLAEISQIIGKIMPNGLIEFSDNELAVLGERGMFIVSKRSLDKMPVFALFAMQGALIAFVDAFLRRIWRCWDKVNEIRLSIENFFNLQCHEKLSSIDLINQVGDINRQISLLSVIAKYIEDSLTEITEMEKKHLATIEKTDIEKLYSKMKIKERNKESLMLLRDANILIENLDKAVNGLRIRAFTLEQGELHKINQQLEKNIRQDVATGHAIGNLNIIIFGFYVITFLHLIMIFSKGEEWFKNNTFFEVSFGVWIIVFGGIVGMIIGWILIKILRIRFDRNISP
jgi:hypothetical protein